MKRLLLLITICISSVSFGQVPSYVPTNGLEVYYSFSGNANEEINSLDGVINGPTLTDDFNSNPMSAYIFNGTTDYIDIPFEFINGGTLNSQSFRVRFKINQSGDHTIWNKDGSWQETAIRVYTDNSLGLFWAYPNYYSNIRTNANRILPGVWYDVIIIISQNTGQIFINGILESSYQTNTVTSSNISYSHSGSCGTQYGNNRFGFAKSSCNPNKYFNGVLDEFGIWNRPLSNCEISNLYLSQIQSLNSTETVSACTSYQWIDGNTYTQSTNTPTFVLTNAQGCDSTVTLDLTITQPNTGSETVTECDSYTWSTNGQTYNQTGQYTSVLTNQDGCDSTVTLNLTITNSNTGSETVTECDSYTWSTNGQTYTQSGQYTSVLTNQDGCDSTVTLNLTITNSNTGSETVTECDSYTWSTNGQTYTQSGQYTEVLPNQNGCDSTITLNLTIETVDITTQPVDQNVVVGNNAQFTVVTSASNPTYQWQMNDGTGWADLFNAGQYSGTDTDVLTISNVQLNQNNFMYRCVVTSGNCETISSVARLTIQDNVGLEDLTKQGFTVFPNPTTNSFTITSEKVINSTFRIMDGQGRAVSIGTMNGQEHTMDISKLSKGVYSVVFEQQDLPVLSVVKE